MISALWKSGACLATALASTCLASAAMAQEATPLGAIPEAFHGEWGHRGDCAVPLVITAETAFREGAAPLYPREAQGSDLIVLARVPDLNDPDADEGIALRLVADDVLHFGALDAPIALILERCVEREMPPL